jgi:flagellar motility protein MotE (MotC chaperone)
MKRTLCFLLLLSGCGAKEKLTEKLCPAPEAVTDAAPASHPVEVADERFLRLRTRRLELDEREKALQAKEKAFAEQQRVAAIKPQKPVSVDPLPGIFASMDRKAAARVLSAMAERDAAELLQHAETERASEVLTELGALDVQRAARIAKLISRNHQEVQHARAR